MMSFEAITMISQAEETARKECLQAAANARAAEEKALEEGKNSVAAAVARAREEIQNKQAELEAEAHARAKVLEEETEKQKAAMRAGAEKKLDAAAMLIVERIVNS
ncbi:MAG: hypothetical protein IJ987_08770 [Firmicutes bacterium]|nr:hypothetical protein [Bacillota bacterium]